MSAVEFYKKCKDRGLPVLVALDYDGTVDKMVHTLPPNQVEPEDGCIGAMQKLLKLGDLPFPCSARPRHALKVGFPIEGIFCIANEGHIVDAGDLGTINSGPMPDWTVTAQRLSEALTLPKGTMLSNEGTAFYCFIDNTDPCFKAVQDAFDNEIKILNASWKDKVERIDYANGVQIAQVKRARKVDGLKKLLRLFNKRHLEKDDDDFKELFEKHIGGLIFFDDSPHEAVTEALQWVKDLKDADGRNVGFAVKVARRGDDLSVVPTYANQHVADQKAVVAMLQEMAAYTGKI